jgi:serine protease Do
MSQPTNSLVASLKKFALPAGAAAVTLVVGGALLLNHASSVHAASAAAPLDDSSVSSLVALDNAVEAVAARVTPAVVNVSVTSRASAQETCHPSSANSLTLDHRGAADKA